MLNPHVSWINSHDVPIFIEGIGDEGGEALAEALMPLGKVNGESMLTLW